MTVQFSFRKPNPALRGVIRQHQIIRLQFRPGSLVPVKTYWPRPAASLAFYMRDRERIWTPHSREARTKPRAVIIGQPTFVTYRQVGADYSVYQIEFEPGALTRLLGLPLTALTDDYCDAEAVFPKDFRHLIERIGEATEGEAMIAAAEAYLLRLTNRRPHAMRAADHAAMLLLSQPNASLDDLASSVGLSTRQMRRDFGQRMGVSPKLFSRISRFDSLIRLRNRVPELDWLEAALWAGYYDHQHLRRDFRIFAGTSPTAFAAAEHRAPEREFGFRET